MNQEYIQAFASQNRAPLGEVPTLSLSADDHQWRYLLTLSGIPYPAAFGCETRVPLHFDWDEAYGLEGWLYRALTPFPRIGARSLFPLRKGKIVGIETLDSETFMLLGGEGLAQGWDMTWLVLAAVPRADIEGLTDALAALRGSDAHPATRKESRP